MRATNIDDGGSDEIGITWSTWWVSRQTRDARWRHSVRYRLAPGAQIGFEWNPLTDDISFAGTLVVLSETDRTPGVIIGTGASSFEEGSGSGQLYFAMLSKHLGRVPIGEEFDLGVSPYVGIRYADWDNTWKPIGGVGLDFTDELAGRVLYDGERVHYTLSYTMDRHTFTLILKKGNDFGFGYAIRF